MTIRREAKRQDCFVKYVAKDRLDQLSETGHHQGVIAMAAAYEYAELEDLFQAAREKGEDPFTYAGILVLFFEGSFLIIITAFWQFKPF